MNLALLAGKQKRLQYWGDFVAAEVHCKELRLRIVDDLKRYRNLLARCWEEGEVSSENAGLLVDLERRLQALHEDAHLHTLSTQN